MIDIKLKDFNKKLIGKWGKYTFYLVDDKKIRKQAESAKGFRDYGINLGKKGLPTLTFKFIPEKEIWISNSVAISKRHYTIGNALAYIRGIERRFPPEIAYEHAIKREKAIREKDSMNKFFISKKVPIKNPFHIDVPEKVYFRIYTTVKDTHEVVKIYLINCETVRNMYKSDFAEGGHGYAYEMIPKDEIWIDNLMKPKEIPIIILHEYTERSIMKYKNVPYVKAHYASSKVEFDNRGIFNKKDAEKLSKEVVLSKLLKNIKL
jgi:hypothetical protein